MEIQHLILSDVFDYNEQKTENNHDHIICLRGSRHIAQIFAIFTIIDTQ